MSVFKRLSGNLYARPQTSNETVAAPVANARPPRPAQSASPLNSRFTRPRFRFSQHSTNVPSSGAWCAQDFMLGVGLVILQPSSGKIVVCYDEKANHYFLPKGRKDLGEKPEEAALREGYEESGYRAELLPLYIPSNSPIPPNDPEIGLAKRRKSTEPIFIYTHSYNPPPRRNPLTRMPVDTSRVYFVQWYVGHIPADAVREANSTDQPDEVTYTSFLMTFDEAYRRLADDWARGIVTYALTLLRETQAIDNLAHRQSL
ncbi:hypothetical protein ONZ45_g9078 [Pleurotus djamor]|nr:hypothetical protein ONZ45_g9078 [Pleurotus djamor]